MRFGCIIAILCGSAMLAQAVEYERDIAPILAKCYSCHGAQQQMSSLRLDIREAALAGGNAGPLLQPGKSADSRLVHYLTGQKTSLNPRALRMPMGGPAVSEKDLAAIRAWIDSGAEWRGSKGSPGTTAWTASAKTGSLPWSFQPVKRPSVPSVRNRSWVRNPIDAFVLARLEAEAIAPSAESDRSTQIRRLSLDLIGLPPTPEELENYLKDSRPDAYQRLVDRLLESPHYGEKWGRFWLDQARYADSEGHELDREREYGWRYRNWVIDSFNRDQPFDQFTVEQIAGDLLPNRTTEQWVATGFHRNNLVNREAGTEPAAVQFEHLVDRTNAVAGAWLSLSVGCAQCHNHKFDPITQKEYYQFMAFVNTFQEVDIDAPLPGQIGPYLRRQAEYLQKRHAILTEYKVLDLQPEWERQLLEADKNSGKRPDWDVHWLRYQVYVDNGKEAIQIPADKRTRKQADAITDFFVSRYAEAAGQKRYSELKFGEAAKKLMALRAAYPQLTQAPAMTENKIPRKSYVHLGGEYDALGVEVQPGVPASLNPLPKDMKPSRIALAQWLVSPDNPLTRRVAVNRIWQELFGRGIVRTSDDLGSQGSKPSHPQLLDWLASEFLERGWSRKQIIREIVVSATYRQKSESRPELSDRDPENELLARQSRSRLPAESIRDAALMASGLLDPTIGGPSVRPYQPDLDETAYGQGRRWKESEGKDRYRRGLYTFFQRANPYPTMITFDAPNANMSVCRRSRSNTPLQALDLLNDPVFVEASQALAVRTLREAPGTSFADRIKYAYLVSLARQPSALEQERLLGLFVRQKKILANDPKASETIFPYNFEGIDRSEGAAWVTVSSVLLNVDEFITKE